MATKQARVSSETGTNISAQITRIQTDRDIIRAKLVNLSLAESSDNLDTLASAIDGIQNNGAIQAEVKEGESYTIPKGYHNGSGVIKGVSGGGNYNLQTKTITPTKQQQNVSSDEGYYGLSSVTVEPIPEIYQDVSSVTASATDVLAGKIIVTSNGQIVPGTMLNNGAVSKTLDADNVSYNIPIGYHNGEGIINIVPESKNIVPTKSQQNIQSDSGKVITSITVSPIPEEYIDTSDGTIIESDIKNGMIGYSNGNKIVGTMPIIEQFDKILDTKNAEYILQEGYYDGTQKVKIVLEQKEATPSKDIQTIIPTDGNVLSSVQINAIPDEYISTIDADALNSDIIYGKTAYVNGEKITGSMPNNGETNLSIDGMVSMSISIPMGYTSGGSVTLTNSIENALAEI